MICYVIIRHEVDKKRRFSIVDNDALPWCCTLHTLVEILIFAVIPVFPLFYMFPLHFDAKRGEKEARDSLLQGSFSNLGKGCQNEI